MDQSEDAMSWEASFTITIGNHLLLPEASDIVFVPYRGVVLYSTVVTLFVIVFSVRYTYLYASDFRINIANFSLRIG